ncbi:MAG: 30S ribosomal protein S4e, partial [Candidatus Bathyarchaeia archaeon]
MVRKMGRIGVNKRLKRSNAPRIWPVHRKEYVWVFKPSPGPHPISSSLPIALLLRDLLHIAKFAREAKKIISKGMVKIDGRVIKDPGFPVGVMDVISIPEIESIYRVFPSKKSLTLHPISKEEEDMKLCRIESKRVLKGGRTQLNLHDGRNVHLVPSEGLENNYALFDVLKIKLSDRSVLEKIKFANG